MPRKGQKVASDVHRRVAEVHHAEGLSIAALAERFGISARSVKAAVNRDHKRAGGVQAKPTSLAQEFGARDRQDDWLTCCQSADRHRFDCPERPSGGPYLPVAPTTARQMVERVRQDAERSAP